MKPVCQQESILQDSFMVSFELASGRYMTHLFHSCFYNLFSKCGYLAVLSSGFLQYCYGLDFGILQTIMYEKMPESLEVK